MKKGFTLAEVLITLGIIGIVAAMTMPALIQRQNEKATVVRLKKTYSILENAYRLAKEENGELSGWLTAEGNDRVENTRIVAETFKKYLKVAQDCGFNPGCLPEGYVKHLDGTDYVNYEERTDEYRLVLADGTALMFHLQSPNYLTCQKDEFCGSIKIFTGTKKRGYTWGKDFFRFNLTNNRIMPSGYFEDTIAPFEQFCNITDHRRENGVGCAAWVIFNENMDYLHCSDLSWNGKRTCKE